MKAWVALLRSVNVGGTGKLAMEDLKGICAACGFEHARTHIASGNVVFASPLEEAVIREQLEQRLHAHAGRPIAVLVRDAEEMREVLAANPFGDANPSQTVAIFLNEAPGDDSIAGARGVTVERLALGRREIYVDYAGGQARSKLSLAASSMGTARNMNTVARMADLATELDVALA